MNIFVVLKQTFDTEEKIVINNQEISSDGVEWIINPYDEYAIEEAVQIKEKTGGEITVITVGTPEAESALRTALAMGADKAILVDIEELELTDAYTTSSILAACLKEKDFDIILCGNVTVDGGSGQVGPRLAEQLGISAVTTVTKMDIVDNKATIERDVEGDIETVEVNLPIVVTAQQGLNEPRYPSLPGIMKAKKKPLDTIEIDDLDLEEEDVEGKTKTVDIFLPPAKNAGKILDGELNQQVSELVSLLKTEAKVV